MITSNKLAKLIWYTKYGSVLTVCDSCNFGLKNKFQLACRVLDLSVYVVDHDLRLLCKAGEMVSTRMTSLFSMWMEYMQLQKVSDMYWIIDPLWVQLAKQSKQGGWHSWSCARVGLCFHTHIALRPLGALDEDAQQSNQRGCSEGDQPYSLLRSIE